MIGKIGGFKIEVADKITHNISQVWDTKTRIGANPARFAQNSWDESITFNGNAVLKGDLYLDGLKKIAKDKKPVSFVVGDSIYAMVIIENIEFSKSIFLTDGKHVKEEFSVTLKRYFNV